MHPASTVRRTRLGQLAVILVLLVFVVGPVQAAPAPVLTPSASTATAQDGGSDARSLIEFTLPNLEAIDHLTSLDADLAEYVRQNADGTVTVNAFVTPTERALYESFGYQAGAVIEDQATWEAARAEREAVIAAERRAKAAAENGPTVAPHKAQPGYAPDAFDPGPEVTIMRVDYFTNYAGRFLSVAARSKLGLPSGGPTMALAWKTADGAYGTATNMSKYTDAGVYMYHTILVRVGALGTTDPVPAMVRVASSTGETAEGPVQPWLEAALPPLAAGFQQHFFTHYMDPYENRDRINALAAEFPNLAEIINLPYQTNGYQRKAMAVMAGTTAIGSQPPSSQQAGAVALYSQVLGHLGGNNIQAEFVNPGVADAPLSVSVVGSRITVSLATNSTGALASTAAQVRDAINANPAASALVLARTWNNGAGSGITQPRALVNLSDFLNAPANYPRGPFQNQMLRIGKQRDGSKIGIFIYCQQHAREWTTSITCVETAERLLRNYAIDPLTKQFVDNLDIFIIPNVNPDGALASYYDNNGQRKNMTNYCDPNGTSGAMPSNRNSWGVDINRNSTVGSRFDGYDGASSSCTNELYAGPTEASEPEMQNELWVADTYANIKFAVNIHSYGGYFMWSPGAYKVPGRITLPAPNIGVEAYFFAGADLVLGRIKEYRNTAILPERTGPICDVLYSAAGNSADDQWYRRGIISYSFETGADVFQSTETGTSQRGVGFQPDYTTEGQHEAMEFASGNYGLLETALQYAFDMQKPEAAIVPNGGASQTALRATFEYVNEPAVIYYTLDGSEPTLSSTKWEAQGPRMPGQVFLFDAPNSKTTLKWIAQDIKGNVSDVRSADFSIDTIAPTLAPSIAPAPTLLYAAAVASPNAVDENSGVASASCEAVDTSSVGAKTLTCTATDKAGNTATVTFAYNIVYGFTGFAQPVNNPPALNRANSAGLAIPLKWRLTDANGVPVTDLASIKVTAVTLDCTLGTTPDLPEEESTGRSGLQNRGDGYYQFNWKTPRAYARSCKTLKLDLGEGPGMEHTALFQFIR